VNQKLFNILLQPIEAIIASLSPIIDQASLSQKLFFADFVRKLLFGYVEEVSSLKRKEKKKSPVREEKIKKKKESPAEWIRKISEIFYESWKISKNWLLIVRNSLSKVVDNELLTMLNSC